MMPVIIHHTPQIRMRILAIVITHPSPFVKKLGAGVY
jgi:hypothetical protein